MSDRRNCAYQSKIYHRFSRLYEPVFNRFFARRARAMIRSLDIPSGAHVLEVGAGTGSSLSAYPNSANVVAIDLSSAMLHLAQEKIDRHGWNHISLRQMDAMNLQFADDQFDYVFAFHVVSVVPDHELLMSEVSRVCKPHGTITIVNHFRSERPWLANIVDKLDPATRRLGWSTTLRISDLTANVPVRVDRRFKTSKSSLFTVVMARRQIAATANQDRCVSAGHDSHSSAARSLGNSVRGHHGIKSS